MTIVVSILLCLGTLFILIASLGILRMPDLYMRMHAATKAGTVGLASLLLAVAIAIPDVTVISRVIGTMLFIFITAPVAAHLLGKATKESGYQIWRKRK
ncbi:monovalent cation/H(+) antiporter subunit G [Vibrio neptunius]|uniref:Monovalent cation/H(+) antiporter subunit G n=1 Tax=Vibrio neptunius TaxID=170651 RepID=A0ABS2ZZ99_9VIBR|nr:monovalent cation/H(+) antiporter subunit G [Vibrio neptunius]MBN3492470.1 monovalent cation/H(+) antiporter subunit G [Vibrio neptunius]MBN3514967.1 monovalent cation/H(+) antiporter subunit G [Vibrio neptunius]MBN3548773.1 monovalent cation/H(+) antiporter subunit G [Vibrio neptunius]MBN3577095.1 monovalent cation/H(+) antiporter subunit G [Vibrio neptunius]MCH9870760.1 monovalent cation/H(+) antiporter subunit G [Vibrio neptunius]